MLSDPLPGIASTGLVPGGKTGLQSAVVGIPARRGALTGFRKGAFIHANDDRMPVRADDWCI